MSDGCYASLFQGWLIASLALCLVASELQSSGWLGRLVAYYKNSFFNEFKQLAPINIKASIEKAPVGYVDSKSWDFESVARLLGLLRVDEGARPVRRALRRAFGVSGPARRFMDRQKSYKLFPSLSHMHSSNLYYDMDTDDEYDSSVEKAEAWGMSEDAVVLVQNPVEARLPSARISVGLLKEILEARAVAARLMPPTKTTPRSTWSTTETTISVTSPGSATTNATASDASHASTANAIETTTQSSQTPSEPPTAGAGNVTSADPAAPGPGAGGNATTGNGTTN